MPLPDPMATRRAGLLLHPTSLPGAPDSGLLGTPAHDCLDWLARAGFSVWQMLPVGPAGAGGSPYQSSSAFAGNPRLIDPSSVPGRRVEATADWSAREAALAESWAYAQREASPEERAAFAGFVRRERDWLVPWALYSLCREIYGDSGWWHWPSAARRRDPGALDDLLRSQRDRLGAIAWVQFLFDQQWRALRHRAEGLGIALFGDLPLYVDLDSADVWWNQGYFLLDNDGRPTAVAGVPPDYFSDTGQRWGNPLYDWAAMAADGFSWWRARFRQALTRFDLLRIDHFRGLESCWSIPVDAPDARAGHWVEVPGEAMLLSVRAGLGRLPLVAEDLGVITDEVRALRQRLGLPGMLVLQFAFDGQLDNPYLPAHHHPDSVVYVGTHDNDTLAGWLADADSGTVDRAAALLSCAPGELAEAMLQAACDSPARLAVFTMQDLLGLKSEARMNTPGTVTGNWVWRLEPGAPDARLAQRWRERLQASGRCPPQSGASPGSG
ncbi:MAG: 4-alpha-glucanotransferase [Chromatiales bacterium]|nr:4-alpha-glucanotransferase [Chromatiales bacterium]